MPRRSISSRSRVSSSGSNRNAKPSADAVEEKPGPPSEARIVPVAGPASRWGTTAKKIGIVRAARVAAVERHVDRAAQRARRVVAGGERRAGGLARAGAEAGGGGTMELRRGRGAHRRGGSLPGAASLRGGDAEQREEQGDGERSGHAGDATSGPAGGHRGPHGTGSGPARNLLDRAAAALRRSPPWPRRRRSAAPRGPGFPLAAAALALLLGLHRRGRGARR